MMASEQTTANSVALAVCLLLAGVSCHEADPSPDMRPAEPTPPPKQVAEAARDADAASADATGHHEPEATKRLLARLPDHPTPPWLVVLATGKTAPGGWATASFDAQRNRITIDTHDVEAFSVDTSRIAIRWNRLVIVRINGRNAELVRRKNPVIRFERDAHRQWVAIGP
ncbi:MAG: hypothetical protein ACE5E5_04755 [Phycisphaerae bacterium]